MIAQKNVTENAGKLNLNALMFYQGINTDYALETNKNMR
jgi:hypothetical protein